VDRSTHARRPACIASAHHRFEGARRLVRRLARIASAAAKRRARQLPHGQDKVRNTLTCQSQLDVGRSPKLLVLVGADDGTPYNGVTGRVIPSYYGPHVTLMLRLGVRNLFEVLMPR